MVKFLESILLCESGNDFACISLKMRTEDGLVFVPDFYISFQLCLINRVIKRNFVSGYYLFPLSKDIILSLVLDVIFRLQQILINFESPSKILGFGKI